MVKSKVQKNNRHQTQKINLEKLCWKIVRIAQKNKKKIKWQDCKNEGNYSNISNRSSSFLTQVLSLT